MPLREFHADKSVASECRHRTQPDRDPAPDLGSLPGPELSGHDHPDLCQRSPRTSAGPAARPRPGADSHPEGCAPGTETGPGPGARGVDQICGGTKLQESRRCGFRAGVCGDAAIASQCLTRRQRAAKKKGNNIRESQFLLDATAESVTVESQEQEETAWHSRHPESHTGRASASSS